jgi:quercetin dioxygenase-like cupin family protein
MKRCLVMGTAFRDGRRQARCWLRLADCLTMDTRGCVRKNAHGARTRRRRKLGTAFAARQGSAARRYRRPMDAFAIDRSDGREDGEDWTENYEELPGGANISIILESTTKAGVGPRLHKHPYAETFIIRRGWATFTVGSEQFRGHAGQVLIVPADTPHKFSTGPDGYEGVHIHAGVRFVTEWLE